MKTIHIHGSIWGRIIVLLLFLFVSLASLTSPALSEEIYKFEWMWPTLQQPWYFNDPEGIAMDGQGNVYVTDFSNNRIHKFSASMETLALWARSEP